MSEFIASARFQPYRLPLRAEWVSAVGSFAAREGWLLRVETDAGRVAYGDCAPLWEAGTEYPREANSALEVWCRRLPGNRVPAGLSATGTLIRSIMVQPLPAAHAAVEVALLDLAAQDAGLPLARYLAMDDGPLEVPVNASLGAVAAGTAEALAGTIRQGYTVLKLKVGLASVERELELLRSLILAPGVGLRLDANGAWDESAASRFIAGCAGLPVEALEEPLANPDPAALRRLQDMAPFSIALDESWPEWDAEALFADPPVRRLVLKPPRLGGLLPALEAARRAQAAGMEVVVTSSMDSACGVMAAAHLAAALDNGLVHGLATSAWLAEDVGMAPRIVGGVLRLPDTPGLGFAPAPGFA
ncbi:MAG: enolase C-terminal domain-like protein [Rhodocyclaceae bacterium]|nr:enolase C-terminal domain-like protein [Rhodocyclaceae bacterium]